MKFSVWFNEYFYFSCSNHHALCSGVGSTVESRLRNKRYSLGVKKENKNDYVLGSCKLLRFALLRFLINEHNLLISLLTIPCYGKHLLTLKKRLLILPQCSPLSASLVACRRSRATILEYPIRFWLFSIHTTTSGRAGWGYSEGKKSAARSEFDIFVEN